MNLTRKFEIQSCDFENLGLKEFSGFNPINDLWPIVYILSNRKIKEAYVGETTDTSSRMASHLKNNLKNKLTTVHLIASNEFNKSATLDIESNLIKYMTGDGEYELTNLNIGLSNHTYYQKKEYWNIFKSIWNKLRAEGIAKHPIEHIDNSDLFKYSPYKTLSEDQKNSLLTIINNLLDNNSRDFVVEGGAGTGKTILAIFLFKLLNSNYEDFNYKTFGEEETEFIDQVKALKETKSDSNLKMALVVPMKSFRNTLKKVFKNIKGLHPNMVIGPAEVIKDEYDIIIVDESHRLRRRVNLGTYFGAFDKVCEKLGLNPNVCSELDWIKKQSKKAIFFYDEGQSIKPSDVRKEDFDKLKSHNSTKIEYLQSQFRVKGGNAYVNYLNKLLNCTLSPSSEIYNSKDYEFILFDSIEELIKKIKLRNEEVQLSRLIAGFSWKWISKNTKKEENIFDIKIGSTELKWNSTSIDWIFEKGKEDEVGCIHTTQGYDLNYAGIIFGKEITYDKSQNEIVILKENYHDKYGKQSVHDPAKLKEFILNIYKTIMLRGIKGTYVYACDENLREYFAQHIAKYNSTKILTISPKPEAVRHENSVKFYDLKAAAGSFSELQNVTDFEWIELPEGEYKASEDLFTCLVVGESMNEVIPNGSICLFRKDTGGSRNGKIVLVQHTNIQDPDFGSGYTVKEYHSKKNVSTDEWRHESITLKPLSNIPGYPIIELKDDEAASLKVVGIFECVLA